LDIGPARVFRGYAERWNAFAPEQLHIDVQAFDAWLRDNVRLLEHDVVLQERRLRKDGRTLRFPGLVGEARYSISTARVDAIRLVNTLASFAEYCGTGRMAAQGMGHTLRLVA
jgi:CRISPR/Cas system endoribonuclease Cas6 (RAMP superfamily)